MNDDLDVFYSKVDQFPQSYQMQLVKQRLQEVTIDLNQLREKYNESQMIKPIICTNLEKIQSMIEEEPIKVQQNGMQILMQSIKDLKDDMSKFLKNIKHELQSKINQLDGKLKHPEKDKMARKLQQECQNLTNQNLRLVKENKYAKNQIKTLRTKLESLNSNIMGQNKNN